MRKAREVKDYSKTIIYRIVCKDTSITDCYIGHTTNYLERLRTHRERTKTHDYLLYKCIRENGGFENWSMIEICKYPCKDKREAESEERKYIELFNPTLNRYLRPIITEEERAIKKKECDAQFRPKYYQENKEKILEYHKIHREKVKHIRYAITECECGGRYMYQNKGQHFKSKKHIEFSSIN
jgi:hypothetical protein